MAAKILYLHDSQGNLAAVQIPVEIWEKIKDNIPAERAGANSCQHDLAAFAEFQDAWSFPYAYEPQVECPLCHSATADWQKDDKFVLKNANIGGMLVFHCRSCGATLRQKYFKTHMDYDVTPPAR